MEILGTNSTYIKTHDLRNKYKFLNKKDRQTYVQYILIACALEWKRNFEFLNEVVSNLCCPMVIYLLGFRTWNVGTASSCLLMRNQQGGRRRRRKIRKACLISTSCQPFPHPYTCCIIKLNEECCSVCLKCWDPSDE